MRHLVRISAALVLLGMGLASAANAEPQLELRDKKGVLTFWFSPDVVQKSQEVGTVEVVRAGTRFHHWTTPENASRWARQGFVDAAELNHLLAGGGVAGGGFYASSDPLDSSNFGPKQVIVTLPEEIKTIRSTKGIPNDLITALNGLNGAGHAQVIQEFLRANGISAFHYTDTWFNFIEPGPISRIREPRAQDFFEAGALKNRSMRLASLMKVYASYPFSAEEPWIQKNAPSVAKVLGSDPNALTAAERAKLWKEFGPYLTSPYISFPDSELLNRTQQVLHEPLLQHYRAQLRIAEEYTQSRFALGRALEAGVRPEELIEDASVPKALFPNQLKDAGRNLGGIFGGGLPNRPYGQKLSLALEFIDTQDILASIAKGETEPWRRYDGPGEKPLLERWTEAQNEPDALFIHRILTQNPKAEFRDHPIVAGGDIMLDGKGYYRATAHQKEVLEKNPYLVVDARPDADGNGFLIRHEYPSASTYKKFEYQLSPDLASRLKSADRAGKLKTPNSPEFKRLTQEIVKELLDKAPNEHPDTDYLHGISVHPFSDYNGRTFRALYKKDSGQALYLRDWNLDLLMTPEEFAVAKSYGSVDLDRINAALARAELENPEFPKYFDQPELWQVGAEVESGQVGDRGAFVARMKEFYSKPENLDLIRQKRFPELLESAKKSCPDLFQGLSHTLK